MRLSPDLTAKCLALAGAASKPIAHDVSEKDFQRAVIALAKRNGWLAYHTADSRKSAAGFPDLVLVRERVVWMELKSANGIVSAAQQTWIDCLRATGAEVYVFRPIDWADVERVLTGGDS